MFLSSETFTIEKEELLRKHSAHIRTVLLLAIMTPLGLFSQVQEYVLQAGDVISIQVVEHPEFTGRHKIRPDGRINFPVIGEIEVASLTPAQMVKIMQGKLASYVNNPVVSVSIEAYYANKIYVMGDVGGVGEYEIYEPVDVLKALAMCGGVKNLRVKMMKIIRADGTTVDVPVDEDFWTGKTKQKYLLYPGDTLFVPSTFKIPFAVYNTILTSVTSTISLILLIITLSSRG